MVQRKKVAVIGGGLSGLAAAKAFDAKGHRVCGIERGADFGGVWDVSRSYPDVQTQSPKELYRFTDMAMPDDYAEWPKGHQVQAYLGAYADKHRLRRLFRFGTEVVTMDRRTDGAGWTLRLRAGSAEWQEAFDFVAVCSGQFSTKNDLTHPGQDAFEAAGGQVLHSSDYTDASIARDRDVVVLGASKSGTDIAVNAAKSGARSVRLVYRENVWRIPYFVGGINFKRLLYTRAQEVQFNGWSRGRGARIAAAVTKPLVWANFRGLETLLKTQLGLKRHNMVPDAPIETTVSCSVPIVTPGLFEALDDGRIVPTIGTFERYRDGRQLQLSTGEVVPCDLAIQAVGWKLGLPFLPKVWRDKLIEGDGQYRVYRIAVNPQVPDMGFVGFNSSFCTTLSSELVAEWLVRYMDGQLSHKPETAAMDRDIDANLAWRRTERPAAQVYGGLCVAPFHFRHFDELLTDMGARKWKRTNPLVEYFTPPDADAYGAFLQTVPAYRAG